MVFAFERLEKSFRFEIFVLKVLPIWIFGCWSSGYSLGGRRRAFCNFPWPPGLESTLIMELEKCFFRVLGMGVVAPLL
jgi:hypothetical protein